MNREDERPRERPAEHRRRTRRAERHATSEAIRTLDGEDIDATAPTRSVHDLGHKGVRSSSKVGRGGFKVWKTTFWKRRTALRRDRAIAERQIPEE